LRDAPHAAGAAEHGRQHRPDGIVRREAEGTRALPKVGISQANEYERRQREGHAPHPFSDDPTHGRGPARWIAPVIIGALALIGIVALVLFT
jgi:hypothetical protein